MCTIVACCCCCCSVIQWIIHVQLFVIPWITACQASFSFTNSQSFLELCPLSRWYHPTFSSFVVPLSSFLQCFPASWSFLMSWLFASGGQSIGASASASVLPMNIQGWFLLGLTCLISLMTRRFSKVFSTPWRKSINFHHLSFFMVQLSHPYGKTTALTVWNFAGKVMSAF